MSRSAKTTTLRARILSGSIVLLTGSGLTTAINLAYNIIVAQFLGPQGFGHATVVYTLLTLLSALTLSFQIVSTKAVAQQASPESKSAAYRGFHRSAVACGLTVACLLFIFRANIAGYLNLPDSTLVAILAIGAAFYVPLGCRRGYVQGACGFRRLAANLVLEGAVRLGGTLLLILLGFGVRGVIAANAAALVIAYFAISPRLAARIPNPLNKSYALRETSQALVFFSGQVLINNCDIVLVKHFFNARTAGVYAAIAMVGRVIFSFSSAVVNTTFPLVAGTNENERRDLTVIATSLLLVFGTGTLLAITLWIAPASLWMRLFGSDFHITGNFGLPSLLALYAFTTVVYSLSVVIITYEMSYKIANTSWIQLTYSVAVIAGICRFHSSLPQVIFVQLVLMIALLISVAIPFLLDSLTRSGATTDVERYSPVRLIGRMSEDAVIAEFLKSDFSYPVFREYQDSMRNLVKNPNLGDVSENAKRRALLHLRHLALWKELPSDTEWYEAELDERDIRRIKAFPRAQWRKLAPSSFSMMEVIKGLDSRRHTLDGRFLSKLASIGDKLNETETDLGAVILIGVNRTEPLTALDGNHRLVAAMLTTPPRLEKLRFICGLSPQMMDCCWYNTNLVTLFSYGRNVLKNTLRNPEAELARLLRSVG